MSNVLIEWGRVSKSTRGKLQLCRVLSWFFPEAYFQNCQGYIGLVHHLSLLVNHSVESKFSTLMLSFISSRMLYCYNRLFLSRYGIASLTGKENLAFIWYANFYWMIGSLISLSRASKCDVVAHFASIVDFMVSLSNLKLLFLGRFEGFAFLLSAIIGVYQVYIDKTELQKV